MESKRKKRQVHKAQVTPQPAPPNQNRNAEALIKENAQLVEELFSSRVWQEIVFPLLQESIASVAGRFTNGRFYHGQMVKSKERDNLAGYQFALEEFHNRLREFIDARDNLVKQKKDLDLEKKGQVYNTFLEELNETDNSD